MRWLVASAALVLVSAPSRVPPIPHPDYGVVTSVQYLDGVGLARLAELGAGSVRVGMGWDLLEGTRGRFDFRQVDPWVQNAHRLGLHILFGLGDPPAWAAPCAACMPYSLWDWYGYVYRVIDHFRYLGDDVTFGIWNEPNLAKFLNPPQPDLYADLFDYADMARRDANPAARLAGPETDHGALVNGWLSAVLARMTPRLAPQDVLALHWYPGKASPEFGGYMQEVRGRIGTREIWLTETGEGTIDDEEQARKLVDIVNIFNRRPSAQWAKLFVYRLAGENPADPDASAQLLRPDFSPRASFYAYAGHMYRTLTINLRAVNGRYVGADDGGGSTLLANRSDAGPSETFELDDLNGGVLRSGDLVRIKTSRGAGIRLAGGTSLLATDGCVCSDEGVFLVEAVADATDTGEPRIALRSYLTGRYVSAWWGSRRELKVIALRPEAWETFQLVVR